MVKEENVPPEIVKWGEDLRHKASQKEYGVF
jgi:hypothetical protein